MDRLDDLGVCIDSIDDAIFELIARRTHLARRAGDVKRRERLPLRRPEVEKERIDRIAVLATEKELDPKIIRNIWEILIEYAVSLQEADNPSPGGRKELRVGW